MPCPLSLGGLKSLSVTQDYLTTFSSRPLNAGCLTRVPRLHFPISVDAISTSIIDESRGKAKTIVLLSFLLLSLFFLRSSFLFRFLLSLFSHSHMIPRLFVICHSFFASSWRQSRPPSTSLSYCIIFFSLVFFLRTIHIPSRLQFFIVIRFQSFLR